MIKTKSTVASRNWNLNLRNKVGDSVSHLGNTWTNTTGRNSEPTNTSADWKLIVKAPSTIFISNLPFELIKNKSIPNLVDGSLEPEDCLRGFTSTGEFIFAKYLGGDSTDFENETVYNIFTGI